MCDRERGARTGSRTPGSSPATSGSRSRSSRERAGPPDVVVVDPPRAGLAGKALRRTGALEAPRIVYVSCNPTTLASDLAVLRDEYGYRLERCTPRRHVPAHAAHRERLAAPARSGILPTRVDAGRSERGHDDQGGDMNVRKLRCCSWLRSRCCGGLWRRRLGSDASGDTDTTVVEETTTEDDRRRDHETETDGDDDRRTTTSRSAASAPSSPGSGAKLSQARRAATRASSRPRRSSTSSPTRCRTRSGTTTRCSPTNFQELAEALKDVDLATGETPSPEDLAKLQELTQRRSTRRRCSRQPRTSRPGRARTASRGVGRGRSAGARRSRVPAAPERAPQQVGVRDQEPERDGRERRQAVQVEGVGRDEGRRDRGGHRRPTSRHAQPEPSRGGEEQGEEEDVGRPEPRRRVLSRQANATAMRSKMPGSSSTTTLSGRGRPTRCRPTGSTAATSTTHESSSNSWRNQKPKSANVTIFATLKRGLQPGEVEEHSDRRRSRRDEQDAARPSANGSSEPDDGERRGQRARRDRARRPSGRRSAGAGRERVPRGERGEEARRAPPRARVRLSTAAARPTRRRAP